MKMIKIYFLAVFFAGLFFMTESVYGQTNVYGFSVPKTEGGMQLLSEFQGKKILIITLPIQQSVEADSMLYCLDTLASSHAPELAVIAVPAYEDGFTTALKDSLMQWYRNKLGNYIIITDGLFTRKTSGTLQHPLFKWMTSDDLNEVFNVDVEGPAFKFFIKTNGQLYGVIGPQAKISGRAVQNTLNSQ